MTLNIKDHIDNELNNIQFEISCQTIEKQAKAKHKSTVIKIISTFLILTVLSGGIYLGKNLNNSNFIINPTNTTEAVTDIIKSENQFKLTAFAINIDNNSNIEQEIKNAVKNEISGTKVSTVMNHKISIDDFENNGKIYHIFHTGEQTQEYINGEYVVNYTEPLISVTGDNIKHLKFSSDNSQLSKNSDFSYEVEFDFDKQHIENNYVGCLLPETFSKLAELCNTSNYEFKFNDIPKTTIEIEITFDNGEIKKQKIQTYYNNEGYFSVKNIL